MPWTKKQIPYLLGKRSPLSLRQMERMREELKAGGKRMIRKKGDKR